MRPSRIIWLLFIIVCIYQALDIWQTHLLLELGAYERNPIICLLAERIGSMGQAIILLKAFFVTLLGVGLVLLGRRKGEQYE